MQYDSEEEDAYDDRAERHECASRATSSAAAAGSHAAPPPCVPSDSDDDEDEGEDDGNFESLMEELMMQKQVKKKPDGNFESVLKGLKMQMLGPSETEQVKKKRAQGDSGRPDRADDDDRERSAIAARTLELLEARRLAETAGDGAHRRKKHKNYACCNLSQDDGLARMVSA